MREIKFRAWDKWKNKWVHVDDKLEVAGEVDRTWAWITGGSEYNFHILPDFRIEVMQYTGFKDKNGKEIYERDIISSFYFVEQIGEVKQHESGEWYLDYGDVRTDSLLSELKRWKCKVIGNIYENRELLEAGNG